MLPSTTIGEASKEEAGSSSPVWNTQAGLSPATLALVIWSTFWNRVLARSLP